MATDTHATIDFLTPSASCGGCRDTITSALTAVDGVASASLDLETKRTTVVYEPERVAPSQLAQVLTDAGYAPADG